MKNFNEYIEPILIFTTAFIAFIAVFRALFYKKIIYFTLLFLNRRRYKVIHGLKFNYKDTPLQIDHLLISKYGFFVINIKSQGGLITGNEHAEYWKQIKGSKRYKLNNPIVESHLAQEALKDHFNLTDKKSVKLIVLFTWKARLKVNCKTPVIKYFKLLKTIKRHKTIRIAEENVTPYYQELKSNRNKALGLAPIS